MRSRPWPGLTAMQYLCHKWPQICSTCRKHFPVLSSFMIYHPVYSTINRKWTQGLWNVKQLLLHYWHPMFYSSYKPGDKSWMRKGLGSAYDKWNSLSRSLILCACFVDRCLYFCTFSFGHCVDCSSSIYGFWLPLWYLQALLITRFVLKKNRQRNGQKKKDNSTHNDLQNIDIKRTIKLNELH
jgi:hypothetical protein